jgi:hypothetical protein
VAHILYVSNYIASIAVDELLTLYATGRSFGTDNSLVEYEWTYTAPDGSESIVGNQPTLSTTISNLPGWAQNPGQPGWAKFSFRVKDENQNWSEKKSVEVYLAPTVFKTFAPIIIK